MSVRNTSSRGRILLGLAVSAMIVAVVVVRRLAAALRLPFAGRWRRALATTRGDEEAARLISLAQARFDELYAERPRLATLALRVHLERGILPGLALYQTLLKEGDDQKAALAEMERMMAATVDGLRGIMQLLGRLPNAFAVFRRVEPRVVRLGFPSEGWEMTLVEDSDQCVAYNVQRCFYLDTLRSYGAPELTGAYCGGDDVVFPALAPAITWERTMTLGRGNDRCDFRWGRGTREGATVEMRTP